MYIRGNTKPIWCNSIKEKMIIVELKWVHLSLNLSKVTLIVSPKVGFAPRYIHSFLTHIRLKFPIFCPNSHMIQAPHNWKDYLPTLEDFTIIYFRQQKDSQK